MTYIQEQKILKEVQDRLKVAMEFDKNNRQLALEDLEFVAIDGKQWPEDIATQRIQDGRPCITTNKMAIFIDQVVGDQRMNRPSIKVVPVDSQADVKVAEILGGWIKHVQKISKSDIAIDHAFEHSIACGYGALRVVTKYVSDSSFEQEAFIEKVDNALAVFWGQHSEYDCSDADYCFIISDMSRDEYREKFKAEPVSFDSANSQFVDGWSTKDTVRLAEYFVKVPDKKKLYLLVDGQITDELREGDRVEQERTVDSYKIMWYLLSGNKILESNEWVGKKYIPVVPVWGKEFNVGGKRVIRGLIRNAKDAQRMYNYMNSLDTELIALQPRAPYLVTPAQIAGHESQWKEAHHKNFPYLLTNFDQKAPGWPKREIPPQVSSAMVTKIGLLDQEMRDTIGLQKASLGMQSNERSGVAIRERKMEGDVGTFAFIDNLSRSIEHLGRILVDIAPRLLDTERIIRLGMQDNEFTFERINTMIVQEDGSSKLLNDLSVGMYDVVVTVGPSFSTQRSEARQSMAEFLQYYPAVAPIIGDLYAKVMDWPGADELAERLQFMLPPEIRAMVEAKAAKKNEGAKGLSKSSPTPSLGAALPVSLDQVPPQVSPLEVGKGVPQQIAPAEASLPDPRAIVETELSQIKLQEAQVKLEQEKMKLQELELKNRLLQKELEGGKDEIPRRRFGGPVQKEQPYIVGEAGPEVVVPSTDGEVVPYDQFVAFEYASPDVEVPLPEFGGGGTEDASGTITIEVEIDGEIVEIPLVVPTLTPEELQYLLMEGTPTPQIVDKAIAYYKETQGLPQTTQGLEGGFYE